MEVDFYDTCKLEKSRERYQRTVRYKTLITLGPRT